MNDKASNILKNIAEKKIRPKSRWVFLAQDYLIWIFFGLTSLFGALAISVIIFVINDNDWDIYKYLSKSFWAYFLILIPYFWIIILGLFSFLAYFNYKHTRKGYLLNPYVMILGSIFASLIMGWALFAVGASEKIDKAFAQKIPYYKNTEMHKLAFWSNPDKGLMAGRIIEIKDRDNFSISDLNSREWQVNGKNIIWENGVQMKAGEKIKIIGKMNEKNNAFLAQEVRPWGCGHKFYNKAVKNNTCDKGMDSKTGKNEPSTCLVK